MNKEILDFEQEKEPTSQSKHACYYGLASIVLLLIMFGITVLKITYRIDHSVQAVIFKLLTLVLLLIGIKGIQFTHKSLKEKEPRSFRKGFAIFINLIVFLLLIFVLLSYFFDMGLLFGY